jgi:tetratricopeptide (TPR) repeat protein
MARVLATGYLDFHGADASLKRALELAPGDVEVLMQYADSASSFGHLDEAIAAARRVVGLDPLTARSYRRLAQALMYARQYPQAVEAINRGIALSPTLMQASATLCYVQYAMGQFEAARQTCAKDPEDWWSRTLLAVTLHKLNRRDEARDVLAKLVAELGPDASFQYAEIYAQWGDLPKALDALEAAYRVRDPGLILIKTDVLLDPIRNEPRYRELMRKLDFPT